MLLSRSFALVLWLSFASVGVPPMPLAPADGVERFYPLFSGGGDDDSRRMDIPDHAQLHGKHVGGDEDHGADGNGISVDHVILGNDNDVQVDNVDDSTADVGPEQDKDAQGDGEQDHVAQDSVEQDSFAQDHVEGGEQDKAKGAEQDDAVVGCWRIPPCAYTNSSRPTGKKRERAPSTLTPSQRALLYAVFENVMATVLFSGAFRAISTMLRWGKQRWPEKQTSTLPKAAPLDERLIIEQPPSQQPPEQPLSVHTTSEPTPTPTPTASTPTVTKRSLTTADLAVPSARPLYEQQKAVLTTLERALGKPLNQLAVEDALTTDISFITAVRDALADLEEQQFDDVFVTTMRNESIARLRKQKLDAVKRIAKQAAKATVQELTSVDSVAGVRSQSSVVIMFAGVDRGLVAQAVEHVERHLNNVIDAVRLAAPVHTRVRLEQIRLFYVTDAAVSTALVTALSPAGDVVLDRPVFASAATTLTLYDSRVREHPASFVPTSHGHQLASAADDQARKVALRTLARAVQHAATSLTGWLNQASQVKAELPLSATQSEFKKRRILLSTVPERNETASSSSSSPLPTGQSAATPSSVAVVDERPSLTTMFVRAASSLTAALLTPSTPAPPSSSRLRLPSSSPTSSRTSPTPAGISMADENVSPQQFHNATKQNALIPTSAADPLDAVSGVRPRANTGSPISFLLNWGLLPRSRSLSAHWSGGDAQTALGRLRMDQSAAEGLALNPLPSASSLSSSSGLLSAVSQDDFAAVLDRSRPTSPPSSPSPPALSMPPATSKTRRHERPKPAIANLFPDDQDTDDAAGPVAEADEGAATSSVVSLPVTMTTNATGATVEGNDDEKETQRHLAALRQSGLKV